MAGRCETQLGPRNVSCWPFIASPPHMADQLPSYMQGELYMPSAEEQFLSTVSLSFFFMFFWHFHNFLLCRPSQKSARSQVQSQVATHQEIGSQLWAGAPDLNQGLQDNSLVRYHWATMPSITCHCHSVLWHTGSHCIIIICIISNLISILPPTLRNSKLNLLGCHYASSPTRSLCFLELFSNSPLNIFGHLSKVQPPAWLSRELSDLSGLVPKIPPWASLVFSAFGCLSWGPPSHLTVLRAFWSEWTRLG
jgi:hypothetical protein